MANVRSLDDLKERDSDSDDGKHNELYTGGKSSGQVVRGPPPAFDDDDDEDEDDRVGSLFNKARNHGAVQGTSADLEGQRNAFKGTANTLQGGSAPPPVPSPNAPRTHVITFYKNGMFTVDDGPARSVVDPANQPFIQSIGRGECPDELDPGTKGAPVTVNLVRKEEDYKEADKPKYTAFQGSGRSLASGSGSGATASGSAVTSAAVQRPSGEWEGVDESKPTTSLQLRLADGSRMVARFNHHHTMADVRRFIRASRPDQKASYQLMTAFPSKLVDNETQTLEAGGLLNAVLIQKLC